MSSQKKATQKESYCTAAGFCVSVLYERTQNVRRLTRSVLWLAIAELTRRQIFDFELTHKSECVTDVRDKKTEVVAENVIGRLQIHCRDSTTTVRAT